MMPAEYVCPLSSTKLYTAPIPHVVSQSTNVLLLHNEMERHRGR